MTSSVTSSGCTTETGLRCRATAWNANAPIWAAQPASHRGLRSSQRTSWRPAGRCGSLVLAMCRSMTLTALHNAASNAKAIPMRADHTPAGAAPRALARLR